MPFDGRGNFSRLHRWEDDRLNGIEIVTDHMDEEHDNFADGLSQCFLKNGLSAMQNDFDAGNFKVRNIANGTTSLDAVNKGQLDTLQSTITPSLVPTGSILPYGGSTAPNGYLLCNGAAVSRTTYAALFAVIGTTYGSGNGTTTFNLPSFENIVYDVETNVPVKGNGNNIGLRSATRGALTTVQDFGLYGSQSTPQGSTVPHFNASTQALNGEAGKQVAGTDTTININNYGIGLSQNENNSGIIGTVTRSVLTCKHIIKI